MGGIERQDASSFLILFFPLLQTKPMANNVHKREDIMENGWFYKLKIDAFWALEFMKYFHEKSVCFFITMRWLPSKPEIVWYWYCHKSFSRNIVEKSRWPWCPAGDASRLLAYYISLLSGLENIDDQNRTPNSNKGLFTYYHFIIQDM